MEDIHCWEEKFEICGYAAKLLDKITYLNKLVQYPIDIREVKKGIYYARKYHGTQMRQSGDPYYSHPVEVAYMVAEFTAIEAPKLFHPYMIIVSLLHDTIEDTVLTEDNITQIFDKNIARQVEALTRIKPYGKISSGKLVDLLLVQKNRNALIIKLFDRLHNIQTIGAKSPEKAMKVIKETIEDFLLLSAYLEIRSIEKQLLNICATFIKQHFPDRHIDINHYLGLQHSFLDFQSDVTRNNSLLLQVP